MLDLNKKIEELLQRHPDPRDPAGVTNFEERQFRQSCPPTWGIVVDNKDPDCLGRLKLMLPLVGPNAVTPWYQVLGHNRKNEAGWWVLPDIGTQVVVCFPYGNRSQGIVLGCIYDMKHKPPEHSTDDPGKSYLIQTKNHRIEIIDEDGKEEIRFETAEGKMRAILGSKGIELINELDGGIEVNCKKLNFKGKNINIKTEKDFSIKTDGNVSFKEKGKFTLTADKEVTLKGKNIKLSGSKGVAAEGKQIAVEDDKVVGMDTHIMVVPAGTSTATVPLPHPFIGKLKDKLSKDVKIKDKKCATKDSVAKHDDSMHMQLPGTIKFQNNPKKEGNVTGGTSSKVKINGKEAAVIGSQVTTCNDMGMQNNSTIIAMGASFPMPAIINPKNTEEWKRERDEAEKKEPKFSEVKWSTTSVEEGEEAELTANVQDIADGNMVSLLVFREGKGPEDSIPLATFPLTVKGGSVSAKWKYRADQTEMPPESDPKFVFTAHCAWCNFEKSSNSLEVKLVRPEIKKVEWQDSEGSSTSKGLVGETLKLHAETKDMEGGVTFMIMDDKKRVVATLGADIEGDKADAEWNPIDNRLPDNTNELKYTFEARGNRCKKVESSECQVKNPKVVSMEWDKKAIYYRDEVTLTIKSFEMSDESPTCKIQLFEKDFKSDDDYIFEKDINIDKDEVEIKFSVEFEIDKLIDENEKELEIYPKLVYEKKEYTSKEALLFVKIGELRK
jgi:hypothetical protein